MFRKIEYFYADWCGPCRRMTPQKQRMLRICESNNIPVILHKAPEDKQGKDTFRELLGSRKLSKIPSVIITFASGVFKTFHNLDEELWKKVFEMIENNLDLDFDKEDEDF